MKHSRCFCFLKDEKKILELDAFYVVRNNKKNIAECLGKYEDLFPQKNQMLFGRCPRET